MVLLAILFLATAIMYSSVGLGGGSTYLALLLIWNIPYFIFPVIALSCNITVVLGNCFNYIRAGNLNLKLFISLSSWLYTFSLYRRIITNKKRIFEILLFLVLLAAGTLLLINFKSYDDKVSAYKKIPVFVPILIGGLLGFISWSSRHWRRNFLSPICFN